MICGICREDKSVKEFNRNNKLSRGRQAYCKKCFAGYQIRDNRKRKFMEKFKERMELARGHLLGSLGDYEDCLV